MSELSRGMEYAFKVDGVTRLVGSHKLAESAYFGGKDGGVHMTKVDSVWRASVVGKGLEQDVDDIEDSSRVTMPIHQLGSASVGGEVVLNYASATDQETGARFKSNGGFASHDPVAQGL